MAEVRMPKMGDGMEEGTINVWLKKEGEQVNSGDPIAEVETDKANVEITAYETGVLSQIIVPVGKTVPIGEIIAWIGGLAIGATPSRTDAAANSDAAAPKSLQGGSTAPEPIREAPAAPFVTGGATPAAERVKASPLARRMAKELGLDLAQITGTGPGGRIGERDIKAFSSRSGHASAPLIEGTPPTAASGAPTTTTAQEIQPSKMRAAIGRRTVQSKQTIPHFYVTMVVEMDRALTLLKELNADSVDGKPGAGKVTVNDLIVKACAVALSRVPEVNATFTPEGTIRRFAEAHVGVAVGIDEGLIIPVVRDCHRKTLRQISTEAKDLIGRARNNQLKPEEYTGGTFSVSNLGMMGVDEFIAIINPPEAAILAIGGVVREPVVVGDADQIVIKSRMKVSLSADHRLLDGVSAARFLQEVKKAIEAPFMLLS